MSRAINRHAPEEYYSLVSYFYEHLGTRSDTLNPTGNYMSDWEETHPDYSDWEYLAARANVATVRSVKHHRLIALVDIISPGIKNSQRMMAEHTRKLVSLLEQRIHVLVIDPFPPGPFDPNGVHGEIWKRVSEEAYAQPANRPLTVSTYHALYSPRAIVRTAAFGESFGEIPLYLGDDRRATISVDETYREAWEHVPKVLKADFQSR